MNRRHFLGVLGAALAAPAVAVAGKTKPGDEPTSELLSTNCQCECLHFHRTDVLPDKTIIVERRCDSAWCSCNRFKTLRGRLGDLDKRGRFIP